jgi:hypothetical protein
MDNLSKLKLTLSTLSDGEISSISKSFTSNIDIKSIREQLIGKSNFSDFDFDKKDLSNSLINELTIRLLSKNIDLGRKNKIVNFLKRLFKFRFSYKTSK